MGLEQTPCHPWGTSMGTIATSLEKGYVHAVVSLRRSDGYSSLSSLDDDSDQFPNRNLPQCSLKRR